MKHRMISVIHDDVTESDIDLKNGHSHEYAVMYSAEQIELQKVSIMNVISGIRALVANLAILLLLPQRLLLLLETVDATAAAADVANKVMAPRPQQNQYLRARRGTSDTLILAVDTASSADWSRNDQTR
jgi:hypothetical protein